MQALRLEAVRRALEERRARTSQIVVRSASLRLDGDGRLVAEGEALSLGPRARRQLAQRAGIPYQFLEQCPADLQATMVNRLFPRALTKRKLGQRTGLVLRDSEVVGLINPDLVWLDGVEAMELALDARPSGLEEDHLEVARLHLNGGVHISVVSRQLQAEPRRGDIVRAGIDIRHGDTGDHATRIESYLLRLACENGMLSKVCRHGTGNRARVRRAAAGNKDLTRRRVREAAQQAWQELGAKLQAAEQLANQTVDNIGDLIRAIGEKLRLSDRLVTDLIDALTQDELGQTGTLFDVVNAFSRVGTHSAALTDESRRYLQELSGDLIGERLGRCPRCGTLRRGRMRYFPRR